MSQSSSHAESLSLVSAAIKDLSVAIDTVQNTYAVMRERLLKAMNYKAVEEPESIGGGRASSGVELVDELLTLTSHVAVLKSRLELDLEALQL